MDSRRRLPQPLRKEVAIELVTAADRIGKLKPWTFMSDHEVIGVRDGARGELRIASVIGELREVLGVVFYRGPEGLRYIHTLLTEEEAPEPARVLEGMDCLKVEWVNERELLEPDWALLAAAEFRPVGRGRIWPQFQSWRPGWQPEFVSETEAGHLAEDLRKVARFAELVKRRPTLYEGHTRGEVPLAPGGSEDMLKAEEIEWLPLVPAPAAPSEPVRLSVVEEEELAALPVREGAVFELLARLAPDLAFVDEASGKTCISRVVLMADQESYFVLAVEAAHGASSMHELVGRILVKGLRAAKARPCAIEVADARLVPLCRPTCDKVGVPVRQVAELRSANDAFESMRKHFRAQRSR